MATKPAKLQNTTLTDTTKTQLTNYDNTNPAHVVKQTPMNRDWAVFIASEACTPELLAKYLPASNLYPRCNAQRTVVNKQIAVISESMGKPYYMAYVNELKAPTGIVAADLDLLDMPELPSKRTAKAKTVLMVHYDVAAIILLRYSGFLAQDLYNIALQYVPADIMDNLLPDLFTTVQKTDKRPYCERIALPVATKYPVAKDFLQATKLANKLHVTNAVFYELLVICGLMRKVKGAASTDVIGDTLETDGTVATAIKAKATSTKQLSANATVKAKRYTRVNPAHYTPTALGVTYIRQWRTDTESFLVFDAKPIMHIIREVKLLGGFGNLMR